MCSHKDSVPSLVPEYKVETLYSGTGTVPEFWRGYQEKRCVHIGARRRIEPGNGARAPSVNTASGSRPKSAYGKSFSARFPFSAGRNFIINDTEYVGFGFFFRILVFFPSLQSLNVSSHKPKKFDKRPWIGNCEGFAVYSSTRRSGAKEEWRFSIIKHTWKRFVFFPACCYGFS